MVMRSLAPGFSITDDGVIEKGPVLADATACSSEGCASEGSTVFSLQGPQMCRLACTTFTSGGHAFDGLASCILSRLTVSCDSTTLNMFMFQPVYHTEDSIMPERFSVCECLVCANVPDSECNRIILLHMQL